MEDGMSIGTSLYDEEGAKIVPDILAKAGACNLFGRRWTHLGTCCFLLTSFKLFETFSCMHRCMTKLFLFLFFYIDRHADHRTTHLVGSSKLSVITLITFAQNRPSRPPKPDFKSVQSCIDLYRDQEQ